MDNEEYHNYLNGLTPAEIAENLKHFLPEFEDFDVEEVMLQQESAFLYFENSRNQDVRCDQGQDNNRSVFFATDSVSSSHGPAYMESQLALDEALARALELGDEYDDFSHLYISQPTSSALDHNTRSTFTETPNTAVGQIMMQDDIDPDTMTYEQLQAVGESVGIESKGLPAEVISRLPTFKYRKKQEKEECVICCAEYKDGIELTSLPCAHYYHSECITHWLQIKKHCPVCQQEVQE
ncbi:Anaphase-promoting complex (APC), subunit 11 [Handroanthus impetiginosus]|uniref:Anaphase-promoting complex (APC), subunit 11 n=1 Tax=Handroanthus impetiginosus TaxID=429701 RepID=A0A2G9GGW0_9LAMI|nr:Anaphase-promoting complex (APC), subunit 11 [Handroanthus impetiginosus]